MNWRLALLGLAVFAALAGAIWAFAGRPYRHVDKSQGFSIEFAPDYVVLGEGDGAHVRAFRERGPKEGGGKDTISVLVNSVRNFPTSAAFEEWYVRLISKDMKGFEKLDEGTRKIAGNDAAWITYVQEADGPRMQIWQVFLVSPTRAYIITCMATPGDFKNARPAFEKAVDSFRFE